jgi:hypothetical protein
MGEPEGPLDGAKTYKLRMPPNVPSVSSQTKGLQTNAAGGAPSPRRRRDQLRGSQGPGEALPLAMAVPVTTSALAAGSVSAQLVVADELGRIGNGRSEGPDVSR